MNITLAVDDDLVRRAREIAGAMGKSLNQVVREYLERLTDRERIEDDVEDLRRLTAEGRGASAGRRWVRDDLHARP